MEQPDVMAQMQVLETFHTLAPLLDPSLKLTPNPNGGKRPRKGAPKEQESAGGEEGAKALQVLPLLKMMSQLLIRHDQELSNLRKMDQFIFFFEPRQDRCPATPAELNRAMETTSGSCIGGSDALAPVPDHGTLAATSPTLGETDGESGHGAAVPDVRRERGDTAGQKFPFSSMGSNQTAPLGQEDSNQRHSDGTAFGRAGGNGQGPDTHSAIPCVEAVIGPGNQDHPVEDAAESSGRPPVRADAEALVQLGVDADWSNAQTPLAGTEWPGSCLAAEDEPADGQGPGTREGESPSHLSIAEVFQFSATMCGMRLANSSTWCYANSTVMCLLWTLLSLYPVSMHNWGQRLLALQDFLRRAANGLLALEDELWFRQILHFWGGISGQQDCAEFSLAVLKWLGSPAFNLRWERRCVLDSTVELIDHSEWCTPIKLDFSLTLDTRGTCTVNDLVHMWRQVDSMSTALPAASPCLCLQLDRFVQNAEGVIWRSECSVDFEQTVQFPFFASNELRTDFAEYRIVAGACHLGQDLAGHYRAVLQVRPGMDHTGRPVKWLVTDDVRRPTPVWDVPAWMQTNATVLWLIRADCLMLSQYAPRMPDSIQTPMESPQHEDLLGLLVAQPGIHSTEDKKIA